MQYRKPYAALKALNVARAADLPAWKPEVYDQLMDLFWDRKAVEYVLRLHKQREADGVPLSRTTATTAGWALLAKGQAEEAAKLFGTYLDGLEKGRGSAVHSFVCGCVRDQEQLKAPFDEFAKLLPNFTSNPHAASVQSFWEREVKLREETNKEPREKKPSEWVGKKIEEAKERKARAAFQKERREINLAAKLERIKILKQNRRKNKKRQRELRGETPEAAPVHDSRTEARRTVKLDPKVKAILDAKRKELMAAAGGGADAAAKKKAPPKKKD